MCEHDTHSPGPWEIGDDGPILYDGMLRPVWNIYSPGLKGRLVGSAEHFPEDHYPNANARLIAAAPELLAALEGAIGALEFSRDYHNDLGDEDQAFAQDRLDAALKAIAKAKDATR